MSDLTKKDIKFTWSPDCQSAFEKLVASVTSDSVIAIPDFSLEFILKTDASKISIGCVLQQMHDNRAKVICFDSKKLSDRQVNWITYDRELFALYFFVKQYRHYLVHAHFTAITDHKPLLALNRAEPETENDPVGKRGRWKIYLASFVFTIIHTPGKQLNDADAMSRRLYSPT